MSYGALMHTGVGYELHGLRRALGSTSLALFTMLTKPGRPSYALSLPLHETTARFRVSFQGY